MGNSGNQAIKGGVGLDDSNKWLWVSFNKNGPWMLDQTRFVLDLGLDWTWINNIYYLINHKDQICRI